jgi:hypothetical protein
MPKTIVPTIKSPTQTRPDLPHSPAESLIRRIKIDFWSILCNSCAIASQLPLTKALSLCPRNMFFKIARTLAKTNVPTIKSPTQNASIAQFSTIFAQFCPNADGVLYLKANRFKPRKTVFQFLCTNEKTNCAHKKSPTKPAQIFLSLLLKVLKGATID